MPFWGTTKRRQSALEATSGKVVVRIVFLSMLLKDGKWNTAQKDRFCVLWDRIHPSEGTSSWISYFKLDPRSGDKACTVNCSDPPQCFVDGTTYLDAQGVVGPLHEYQLVVSAVSLAANSDGLEPWQQQQQQAAAAGQGQGQGQWSINLQPQTSKFFAKNRPFHFEAENSGVHLMWTDCLTARTVGHTISSDPAAAAEAAGAGAGGSGGIRKRVSSIRIEQRQEWNPEDSGAGR